MIAKPKERLRLELRRRATHQRAAPQSLSDEDPRVDPHRRMLNVILGTNLPMTPTRGNAAQAETSSSSTRARVRGHQKVCSYDYGKDEERPSHNTVVIL